MFNVLIAKRLTSNRELRFRHMCVYVPYLCVYVRNKTYLFDYMTSIGVN